MKTEWVPLQQRWRLLAATAVLVVCAVVACASNPAGASATAVLGEDPQGFVELSGYSGCIRDNRGINQAAADQCRDEGLWYVAIRSAQICMQAPVCEVRQEVSFALMSSDDVGDAIIFFFKVVAKIIDIAVSMYFVCLAGDTLEWDEEANRLYWDDDPAESLARLGACALAIAESVLAFRFVYFILKWLGQDGYNRQSPAELSPYGELYLATTTPESAKALGMAGPMMRDIQANDAARYNCIQVGVMADHGFKTC